MNVILVGHGYFGQIYRSHLDQHDKFNVVGICDTDYERLRMLTGRTTAPTYDLIKDSVEHDAVVICTPPHEHADLTIKALTANKSALCMKPGAMSMTEYELIYETAEKSDGAYMVDYTWMYAPEYQYICPSMFGDVTSASSLRHVAGAPKPEGIILDLMSHELNMFDDFFWNQNDVSVSCQMLNGVTAALTITSSKGERLWYANASYNATYPQKNVLLRVKPTEAMTNPLITLEWVQNQRFVKIETQGRSIELHFRHEPDPITRTLTSFHAQATLGGCAIDMYRDLWKLIHAAMHSAENDGLVIRVQR